MIMPNKLQSITYQALGQFEETRYEKNHNVVFDDSIKYQKLGLADYAAIEAFKRYYF